MATYEELFEMRSDSALRNRVAVACAIAADAIRQEDAGEPNHANRLAWARAAMANPESVAQAMLWATLAANADATVATIQSATDAQIQIKVDEAVDLLAGS